MQKLVAMLLVAILAGSVTLPNAFSDDNQNNNNHENENDNHKSDSKNNVNTNENDDKVHFGFSNATSVNITLPNGTQVTFGFSNGTNVGQQVSSFVHLIRDVFKHDQNNAKQIIKDCREKARNASPADKKKIMSECKATLKELGQKLRLEQKQLQIDLNLLKEMIIGSNQQVHKQDLSFSSGQSTHKTNSQNVLVGGNHQIHQNSHAKIINENQNKTFGKSYGHTPQGNQNGKSHGHNQE